MELIRSNDSKYTEYEDLLLKRDQLEKEAEQIWIVYQQLFGQLMTELFEEKIECIKNKKIIAYYQMAINHGGKIDAKSMQDHIDKEMTSYYIELRQMLKEKEEAEKAGHSTPYEVKRAKELYRRLAKLLHPDLNPFTDSDKKLQELWVRVRIAYGANDVRGLTELEVLVRNALRELGIEGSRAEIPDIEGKIVAVREEIEEICTTEPYTYGALIEDGEAIEKKKKELCDELEEYKRYRKELSNIILNMLQGGELEIYVDGTDNPK